MQNMELRSSIFEDMTREDLKPNAFWVDFDIQMQASWDSNNVGMARLNGEVLKRFKLLDSARGMASKPRDPIKVVGRVLAPNDVAVLMGVSGDDISRALLDSMVVYNNRAMFVEYVIALITLDDVGFTAEAVGKVYDQIMRSLSVDPAKADWATVRELNVKALHGELLDLYSAKIYGPEEMAAIHKYIKDSAAAVEDLVYEKSARTSAHSPIDVPGGYSPPTAATYKGGKGSLFKEVAGEIGYVKGDLIDPFFGSGAVPLGLQDLGAVGGRIRAQDGGKDLVNMYKVAQASSDAWIEKVKSLYGGVGGILTKDDVLKIRESFNTLTGSDLDRAAQYYVISRHSIDSFVQFSKTGTVYSGINKRPRSFSPALEARLRRFIEAVGKLDISLSTDKDGWVGAIRKAKSGDTVYLDPPYEGRVASTKYEGEKILGTWTSADTDRLIEEANSAVSRGVRVVMSNSNIMADRLAADGWVVRSVVSSVGRRTVSETSSPTGSEILATKVLAGGSGRSRVFTDEFKGYQQLRQDSVDEATKWYYKEFTDYTNQNWLDAIMKTVYPYWSYESQRPFWLARSFVRHPGTFTGFERFEANTDSGHFHLPGTPVEINPFRGTVYGNLTTRLAHKDYPDYYDAVPQGSGMVSVIDFLSRRGLYPGAHVTIPLALFGGLEPQAGEVLPAMMKTPLELAIAAFPGNNAVKNLADRIFPDRFRNYLTILEVNRRGYNGPLIWTKIHQKEELTPEEQSIWDSSNQEASFYSASFEQFGLFRLRPEEMVKAFDEASQLIAEWTGYSVDQQEELRRRGISVWDMVGGLTPSQQDILQELDYYKWIAAKRPLLPSRQQMQLDKLDLDWNDVDNYVQAAKDGRVQLDADLIAARIGPAEYSDQLRQSYDRQREYINSKMKEDPLMTLEGRKAYYKETGQTYPVMNIVRELLNQYYSIELKDDVNPETGVKETDWDTFYAQRDAVEAAVPDQYKAEWEYVIGRGSTPLQQVRKEVNEKFFKPYNKVFQMTLSGYGPEEQRLINEYLALERTGADEARRTAIMSIVSSKDSSALISGFRSAVSKNKEALRYANPMLDAWLRFWGKTTSFKTAAADSMYQRLLGASGRAAVVA